MPLLPVSYQSQRRDSDCLAACAAMVLEYLQIPYRYNRLLRLLKVRDFGSSFFYLQNLERLGVRVQIVFGKDISELQNCLELGLPPIVFLNTEPLDYWNEETGHAVVVIGIDIDTNSITVHDPFIREPAKRINLISFEDAWIGQIMEYAIISLE